ncbi:hypothetical protein AKJ16_DCAP12851 [Drosera capensis]
MYHWGNPGPAKGIEDSAGGDLTRIGRSFFPVSATVWSTSKRLSDRSIMSGNCFSVATDLANGLVR